MRRAPFLISKIRGVEALVFLDITTADLRHPLPVDAVPQWEKKHFGHAHNHFCDTFMPLALGKDCSTSLPLC